MNTAIRINPEEFKIVVGKDREFRPLLHNKVFKYNRDYRVNHFSGKKEIVGTREFSKHLTEDTIY